MKLSKRKLVLLLVMIAIVVLANALAIAAWLNDVHLVQAARHVRQEYLTGTAIAVVLAMLILLKEPIGNAARWIRRCSVCHRLLVGPAKYCPRCGNRV